MHTHSQNKKKRKAEKHKKWISVLFDWQNDLSETLQID